MKIEKKLIVKHKYFIQNIEFPNAIAADLLRISKWLEILKFNLISKAIIIGRIQILKQSVNYYLPKSSDNARLLQKPTKKILCSN